MAGKESGSMAVDKCDICGATRGLIATQWTGALVPITICHTCLLWSNDSRAKTAREWLKKHPLLLTIIRNEVRYSMKEIERLKQMLEEAGIPFKWCECEPITGNAHISYPVDGARRKCSVIQGQYTYGGDCNLLEIMGLLTDAERKVDSVAGWLSAEDVFGRIKRHWEAAKA